MINKKQIAVSLLCAIAAAQLISCGDSGSTTTDTTTVAGSDSTTAPEAEYVFPEYDGGGSEFTFFNSEDKWWRTYNVLDIDTITGEVLDDAVYNRNTAIEDRYKVKIKVDQFAYYDNMEDSLAKILASGEDVYDIIYARVDTIANHIANGGVINLYDVNNLQLDKPWWDQSIIKSLSFGNELLYMASSNHNFMAFDLTTALYFNERILKDFNLEAPYELVKSGKWTCDELNGYIKKVANLNGQADWTWDENGPAIYGMSSHNGMIRGAVTSCGAACITKDENDLPIFTADNARMQDAVEKLAVVLGSEGHFVSGHDGINQQNAFINGRVLFGLLEICDSANSFRDMKDDYGIVPFPKLDENQENYYSTVSSGTQLLTIPITNADPESTAIVMDALAYLSYKDVLPRYYDVTISQKGLRNEESIEMLDLIRDTRVMDIGDMYKWTNEIINDIVMSIKDGDSNVASKIASRKSASLQKMEKDMETLLGD